MSARDSRPVFRGVIRAKNVLKETASGDQNGRTPMRPYSHDLQKRIIAALEAGERTGQVAARFAVNDRTVRRYRQLLRERGSLAPKPLPGRRRLTAGRETELLVQVQAHPDATLAEHCRRWQAHTGQRLSLATMHRAIGRLNWTVKKSA
jgi:transposase